MRHEALSLAIAKIISLGLDFDADYSNRTYAEPLHVRRALHPYY